MGLTKVVRSRSEIKRQQIVEAAGSLFMEQGFVTTSMDEVAQRAGVSKQTVYAHFGSKNDLFVHCIRKKCVDSGVLDRPLGGDDVRQELLTFSLAFIELLKSEEAQFVHRLCVSQAQTHPELSALFFEVGPEATRSHLGNYLAEVAAKGLLDIDDPLLAAEHLLMLVKGMDGLRREFGLPSKESESEQRKRIELTLDVFLRGYQYQQAATKL